MNVGSQLDLDKAAALAHTPLSHFLKLNPGFKKESTSPDGPHRLLVPVQHASAFKLALAQLPYEQRVDQHRREQELFEEKIRQNELLAKRMREEEERLENQRKREVLIARNDEVQERIKAVRAENAKRAALSSARRAQLAKAKSDNYFRGNSATPVKSAKASGKAKAAPGQIYTVKKGDTFFNISKRFAVSRSDIASWNKISPNSSVKLGQKLKIKSNVQQVASAAPTRLIRYSVKKGDSLMQLSRKFGVSVNDLRKSNPSAGSKGLKPGQTLKIIMVNNDHAT